MGIPEPQPATALILLLIWKGPLRARRPARSGRRPLRIVPDRGHSCAKRKGTNSPTLKRAIFSVKDGARFYSPGLGRWLNRDPIGEEGGWNLYVAVANAPQQFLDALGREWMVVEQAGEKRAVIQASCGDRIEDQNIVALDVREYGKWMEPADSLPLPVSASEPLGRTRRFRVPNTVYIVRGHVGRFGRWLAVPDFVYMQMQRAAWAEAGFRVIMDHEVTQIEVRSYLGDKDVFGVSYFGHGPELNLYWAGRTGVFLMWPDDAKGSLHHGLGVFLHHGCKSARMMRVGRSSLRWSDIVSRTGVFGGLLGSTSSRTAPFAMHFSHGTYHP